MTQLHCRYAWVFLIWIFSLLAVSMATAIILDPFRVFGVSTLNARNVEPNTRYLKIEHLKKNRDFTGFVFGTSRSNAYRPALLSQLTGQEFYNLNAQSDTPAGMLLKLRWLLDNLRPKIIMIGLDFDELDQPAQYDPSILQRREHPEVSGSSLTEFRYGYLWPHPKHLALVLYGNYLTSRTWYRFAPEEGRHHFPFYRNWMATDPDGYIASRLPQIHGKRPYRPNPVLMEKLRELLALARRRGIEIVLVVNPTNHRVFKSYRSDTYTAWLQNIVALAGKVWDFSGLNQVTLNDRLYYDVSHFSEVAGDRVVRRIFGGVQKNAHETTEFGILLTPENVSERSMAMAKILEASVSESGVDAP